ncbi:MAG: transketolase C-terminal domain-containing protein, partial [Candidatus Geothermincolia bacterium]
PAGARGEVPEPLLPLPRGKGEMVRAGTDITIATLGVGVHRSLEAATRLQSRGVSAGVIDLKWVSPLDRELLAREVGRTSRLLVVDEDYRDFGLSGEIAAGMLEAGLKPAFARVATDGIIPYAMHLESRALPNVDRIVEAAVRL